MQERNALAVPETLDELCAPARCAVVVYDMQEGIVPQVRDAEAVTRRVAQVLDAARGAGVPVAHLRHTSGYIPLVVTDACGVVDAKAAERSLAGLDYSLLCERTDAAALTAAWHVD